MTMCSLSKLFKIFILFFLFFINARTISSNCIEYDETQLPWYLERIEISGAWEKTKGLTNITIAVIDSGIDFSHPNLNHSCWFNPNEIPNNSIDDDSNGYIDDINGWDFVGQDNNVGFEITDPITSHGTFIAGIITASHENSMIFGIAPNIKIMALRIITNDNLLESPDFFSEAIDYAIINGADVISTSIQMPFGIPGLRASIQRAENHDIPFLACTGNTFSSEGGGKNSTAYPASYPETIAVGASNIYDEKADYSNYGDQIDLVAPVGDENYETSDEIIRSTDLNGGYRYGYGTSFASPQVAAIISLMKSVKSNLSVEDIRTILYNTAIDINEKGWDKFTGYGIVNASAAILEAQKYSDFTKKNDSFPFSYFSSFELLIILIIICVRLKNNFREIK